MGNKILTQYDVQKEPCYYSTELKWRLHSASFKEKPEEKLTIFLFEKKVIERYPKNSKEQILEVLRKDASSLQRLRHPHILSVLEALSEERSTLAFATKPVVGTVAQLLEHNRHELSNLEMKCGLLDAAEALQFLHQDAKTAHLGFSPHSIFIDPAGRWLLGGLGCSLSGVQWGQLVDCPFAFAGTDSPGNLSAEPPPRYVAPEMCNMPAKCGLESDIFSLGLLTYELMCTDRQPLLRGLPRGYTSSALSAGKLPADLHPTLQKILSASPSERPTIAAFINSEFFMDVNLRAIRFLEQLNEKDEAQRVTFLRGLPNILQDSNSPICGQRVLRERVLPRLCSALLFPNLFGVVVPILLHLLKRDKVSDPGHFQARIWPSVKPLFSAKEIPIECVTMFLKELDLLVSLAPAAETQVVLLPFVLRCLELQEPIILNEVLEKVPYLHKKFEYRQVKDQILPRMLQLLLTSSTVKVKVQVLMGIGRIFEIFDKNTLTDVVLTAFEKLTKSDRTPAVCMCLLGCYDAMSKHLGHKITSERILPLIVPLLAEEALSAEQFETQLSVCKKLLQRVEAARRKDYDARKDAQAEAGNAVGGLLDAPKAETKPVKEEEPQTFESLLFAGTAKAAAKVQVQAQAPPPPVAKAGASAGIGDLFNQATQSAPAAAPPMGGFDPFASSTTAAAPAKPASFDPFGGISAAPAAAAAPPAVNLGGAFAPAGASPGGSPLAAGAPPLGGMSMFPPPGTGVAPGGVGGMAAFPPVGGYPGGPAGAPASGPGGGFGLGGMPVAGAAPGGMPPLGGLGMPGAGPGMPGVPAAAPGASPNMMRNMAYDPFAEISGRGT